LIQQPQQQQKEKKRNEDVVGERYFQHLWASSKDRCDCPFPVAPGFSSEKDNISFSNIPSSVRDVINAFELLESRQLILDFGKAKAEMKGSRGVLLSLLGNEANCPKQTLHTDSLKMTLVTDNNLLQIAAAQYAAIVASEEETGWYYNDGDKDVRVNIPIGHMLIFKGNRLHAGSEYTNANKRLLIQSYSAIFPISYDLGIIPTSTL
jgi:hypothetical protein